MSANFSKAIGLGMLAAGLQCLNAMAQGTVTFGNAGSSLMINGQTGNPVAPADGVQAALYWAPAGSTNFIQIGAAVNVGAVLPGIFAGDTCMTGTNTAGGDTAQFQVRAWGGGYATYEQAVLAGNGLIGGSPVIAVVTGNPDGAPPTPPGSLVASGLSTNYVNLSVASTQPPHLQIFQTNGGVELTWPLSEGNVQLQSAGNLTSAWTTVGGLALTNGLNVTVTLPSTNQQEFFYLLHLLPN
jgi:hypothetical protein